MTVDEFMEKAQDEGVTAEDFQLSEDQEDELLDRMSESGLFWKTKPNLVVEVNIRNLDTLNDPFFGFPIAYANDDGVVVLESAYGGGDEDKITVERAWMGDTA